MMNRLLFSSESSGDEEENIHYRTYRERINYTSLQSSSFKETFRLTKLQVEHLLHSIGIYLEPKTGRSCALSAEQRLLTTLSWLGNGGQLHGIGRMHGISKSTVCRIVHEVVDLTVTNIFQTAVNWPENVQNIPLEFYRKGGFPNVCGAVDGTMINIDAPSDVKDEIGMVIRKRHEEVYVNRHGKHALNVMVICGPNLMFYAVNSKWPGSAHDLRVLKNSRIFHKFEDLGWRPFPGSVILGDSGYFPMRDWLVPPILRNPDDPAERRFNCAHKATRRLVENSIGILKERFPCLNHLRTPPEHAARIVMACCTFHNIACNIDRANDLIFVEVDRTNYLTVTEDPEEDDNNQEAPTSVAERRLQLLLDFFR